MPISLTNSPRIRLSACTVHGVRGSGLAYQVSERVELLAHETALAPPARDLAIEGVEEEAKGQEGQSPPNIVDLVRVVAEGVSKGRDYGHDAAKA